MILNEGKKKKLDERSAIQDPLNFISAGVACYAFSLLDELGFLENHLLNEEGLCPNQLLLYSNPLVIETAIRTLECNNILFFDGIAFHLTAFGKRLAEHRGSIGLIYNGYSKVLANQVKIIQSPLEYENIDSFINDEAISKAASHIGDFFFNKKILEIIKKYEINGRICDLGCGNASTLLFLCRQAKLPGIGFDLSISSIENARKNISCEEDVILYSKDICNINEVYADVEVVLQSFVMHDFSNSECKKIFNSFKIKFPNAKLFLYVDGVSSDNTNYYQLPGFDYIHSLFGLKPKNFEETSQLLQESNFEILHHESIHGLTNCHIWIIKII